MRRPLSPDWQDRIVETTRTMDAVTAAERSGSTEREKRAAHSAHRAAMRDLVKALLTEPGGTRPRKGARLRLRSGMWKGLRPPGS